MIIYYTVDDGELMEIKLTAPYCLDRHLEQMDIIKKCAAFAFLADMSSWPKMIRLFRTKEDYENLKSFAESLVGYELVPEFFTYERKSHETT